MFDVIIIGAGIIGTAISRELSKYKGNFLVLEKFDDVSCGTTKANSGIVHAGFDAKIGSRKAFFNVKGAKMFEELSKELDFPYKKNGAFVLAFDIDNDHVLDDLLKKAKANGVDNCEILSGDEIRKIEPNVSPKVTKGLYAKDSGIVSPYEMCIAMAENACSNGVKYEFNKEVINIKKLDGYFLIECSDNTKYETKVLVNSAGVHSDEINNMLSNKKYHITPRKGEYVLLDKEYSFYTKTTLFQLPTKMGKGVLVAPTTHSNILVGPTAYDTNLKDQTWTTYDGLEEVWNKGSLSVPSLNKGGIITQFSGNRAHEDGDDFIVEFSSDVKGLYNLIGIESPGLASSPAIAKYACDDISKYLNLEINDKFNKYRKGIKRISGLSSLELEELIKENPLYGHVICRCEVVSEAEIVDAIRRVPGAHDLDGIKRRTRAGMGRCQMGFCTPRIMEILARELKIDIDDVTKKGKDSKLIVSKIKD